MFNFLGEGGYAETIVKFIYKGESPGPGPVPPGPVPPGPTPPDPPTPTPTPGGGGGSAWLTAQTGDSFMWIIGTLIVVAAICLAVFMYRNFKKSKANASLGQVISNGALASRFILASNFAKICLAVLVSCVALFACFGVAFANVDKSSLDSGCFSIFHGNPRDIISLAHSHVEIHIVILYACVFEWLLIVIERWIPIAFWAEHNLSLLIVDTILLWLTLQLSIGIQCS